MAGLVFGLVGVPAHAVVTTRTWDGSTSGNVDWNVGANWTGDNSPDTSGTNGEIAVIDDTLSGALTGDRTISVNLNGKSVEKFSWTTDTTTFSDTLTLTGNFTVGANAADAVVISSAGAADKKVIDLAGFNFFANTAQLFPNAGPITLRNSGVGGGVVTARRFNGAGIVEAGVIARVTSGQQHTVGMVMLDGSRYEVVSSFLQTGGPTNGFYDVLVDGASWRLYGSMRIRNDLTIETDAQLEWRGDRTLRVGGDMTDLVTTASDYPMFEAGSSGVIIFDGGAVTPRTVNVRRTGITTTGFRVGFDAATPGNAQLAHDLKTTSTFGVMANSVIDLQSFTVDGGVTTIGSATDPALLTFDFSDADTGRIAVTNLTLNDFSLTLEQAGPWTNGQDLILMTYSGTFSGAAELRGLTAPQGFSYDQLLTSDGSVRLTNVNIIVPEPAGIALFATGAGLLLFRRR